MGASIADVEWEADLRLHLAPAAAPTSVFATAASGMERACAELAAAVYLPKDEIQPFLDARSVGRHVDPAGGRVYFLDAALDGHGAVQFALFALLRPPTLVSWTVARGSTCARDWALNVAYPAVGRAAESPDFLRLLALHDAHCADTAPAGGEQAGGFRRLAVGHSKAGAEVVELGLARPGLEVHAFNDGGTLNLSALLAAARGVPVTCHRIAGDIVSAARWPAGRVRYYLPACSNPHSMENFTAGSEPPLRADTVLLFFARTEGVYHLSAAGYRLVGSLAAALVLDPRALEPRAVLFGCARAAVAGRCPAAAQAALAGAGAYFRQRRHHGRSRRAAGRAALAEGAAAYAFAAGQPAAAVLLRVADAAASNGPRVRGAGGEGCGAGEAAALHVGALVGGLAGENLGCLVAPAAGRAPPALVLHWAARELAAAMGARWGAHAAARAPRPVLLVTVCACAAAVVAAARARPR